MRRQIIPRVWLFRARAAASMVSVEMTITVMVVMMVT